MNQLLRVQNFNVSRDGFGAGEHQSIERPFGHADPGDMFAWAGATASWSMRTENSARSAAPGTTTTGAAGGATSLRSTPRYSY